MKRHAKLIRVLALLLVSFLQCYQLHYSAADGFRHFFTLPPAVMVLNLALLLWLNLGAKALLQKWHLALGLVSLLTTVWSFVNFFVLKFHGSPLLFSEFANFGTAMDVIGNYRFAWERRLSWLLLLFTAELGLAMLLWALRDREEKFWIPRSALISFGAFAGTGLLLWLCLFVLEWPKPRSTIGWTWRDGVEQYGYAPLIVEDADRSIHALKEPEGYDAAHLDAIRPAEAASAPERLPDIILILNESFYDLHEYLRFSADAEPLEALYGIEGAVYGKAAITSAGGSTNNTEFELLTSCSLHVLSRPSPFNYLNLKGVELGAPRYLKALGYSSAAMHCANGANYARNRAYPAMGFDQCFLGAERFTAGGYGKRQMLDADNYGDMLRYADTMGEGPRFVYLLTYQNHGGWEKNDEALDTVHVEENYGDLTDDINEYLTSVRMSAEAFRALTERLATSDRPTVVCMLGDHAPSFITHMDPDPPAADEMDLQIRQRLVPYVIWSNCGLELSDAGGFATSVDLLPMIYRAAGIPCSAFQEHILSVRQEIPIRTLYGLYRDWEGNTGEIEESPWAEAMTLYYELEYNALKHGADYRRELFICPESAQNPR